MIRLQQPQAQLTEQQRWAMQNSARNDWLRNNFAASVRGMDPASVGSLVGSGGGAVGAGASLHRAGSVAAPSVLGSTVAGPIGGAVTAYQAAQSGAGLGALSDMAARMPRKYQAHAYNQLGKATLDQAFSGALQSGASGAASGGAIAGPVGAGIGAGVGALTAYLAAMSQGMRTRQGRQAVLNAVTPQGGRNWGRMAAHSPDASMNAGRAAVDPTNMNIGSAVMSGLGSLGHKKLLKKIL